jgi:predicted nucleotidyltransferase
MSASPRLSALLWFGISPAKLSLSKALRMLNPDYRDILSALSDARADYLVVGAYALASHGLVRATRDLDLWVRATPENAIRVFDALVVFGAPADHIKVEELTTVLQLGVDPVRIDILTSVSGLEFQAAWEHRQVLELDGLKISVVSLEDLVANKRATGRPQDLLDIKWIEDSQK